MTQSDIGVGEEDNPTILVSGTVRPSSGIGVIQRHLYPRLAQNFSLQELPSREVTGLGGRLAGLIRGFLPGKYEANAALCVVSPLPFRSPKPLVSIVHDLRWSDDPSKLKSAYRKWDLGRVVRNSNRIVCVSQSTRKQLIDMFPDAKTKSDWAWLGPGILNEGESYARRGDQGKFLLIGSDPRKKNEEVGEILRHLVLHGPVSVVGVNLSIDAKLKCESAISGERCEWLDRPTDRRLIEAYQSSEYYILLGTGEGFGLPFVEAMGTGTIPITLEYDLAREIIADAGILLKPGSAKDHANQILGYPKPTSEELERRYELFSWADLESKIRVGLGGV